MEGSARRLCFCFNLNESPSEAGMDYANEYAACSGNTGTHPRVLSVCRVQTSALGQRAASSFDKGSAD